MTHQPPPASITIEIPAHMSVVLRVSPEPLPGLSGAAEGAALAARVTAFLGLHEGRAERMSARQAFRPGDFLPELGHLREVLIVEPHADPANPGRRFAAWAADLATPEQALSGVWYGASPMTVLACLVDGLQQYLLAQRAKEQRGATR